VTQIGRSSKRHHVAVPGKDGARITLTWAALTDKGYRRTANEDSLIAKSAIAQAMSPAPRS
jgi:protein phosphatase